MLHEGSGARHQLIKEGYKMFKFNIDLDLVAEVVEGLMFAVIGFGLLVALVVNHI